MMNRRLISRLADLRQRDEDARRLILNEGRLYGRYDPVLQQIHTDNARALSRIVSEHGWPGVSLVGEGGCHNAWLIAQHSICTPELQRGFLRALRQAVEAGDAPRHQLARLTDRIRFNEGRPQVYGTVLDWNAQGRLDCAIEDPQTVDERRAAVGLPPLADDIARQRAAVAKEGGEPPRRYDAYQKDFLRWATGVGWRDDAKE